MLSSKILKTLCSTKGLKMVRYTFELRDCHVGNAGYLFKCDHTVDLYAFISYYGLEEVLEQFLLYELLEKVSFLRDKIGVEFCLKDELFTPAKLFIHISQIIYALSFAWSVDPSSKNLFSSSMRLILSINT